MNARALVASLVSLVAGCSSPDEVQDTVLSFEEWTIDSERVPVQTDPAFVDINSTIKVKVDRDALRAKLLEKDGGATVNPSVLALLDTSLDELAAAVPRMQQAFVVWAEGPQDAQAKSALASALEQVGDRTLTIMGALPPELAQVEIRYNAAVEPALEKQPGMATAFSVFQEVVSDEVDRFRAREVKRLQEQGIVVRLGAWTSSGSRLTPVHLGGFDELAAGEFVEYERVIVALDDAQRAQWKAIVDKAKSIDEPGPDLNFGRMADNLIEHLDATLGGPVAALERELDETENQADSLAADVQEQVQLSLDRISVRAERLELAIQQTVAKYRAIGEIPASLFLLTDLRDDALALRDEAMGLVEVVENELATIAASLGEAAAQLGAKSSAIEARLAALGQVYHSLTATARLHLATLQFGEEVLALDIESVPVETQLDLRHTGRREPGDQVVFVMRGGPDDADAGEHETVDSRQFSMFRILGNVSPFVSLAFANPEGATALRAEFQAAPTYNLVYRWGDRDSAFVNRFLTPGVGLAFSALDFDGDDDLELGIGATAAFFQDWVQVGYGYDLGTDDEYWFFGFSLPLLDIATAGVQ